GDLGELVARLGDLGQVDRAHVGAMRVAEVHEGELPIRLLGEVEGVPVGVGEGEVRLRRRLRDGDALELVGGHPAPAGGQHTDQNEEREDTQASHAVAKAMRRDRTSQTRRGSRLRPATGDQAAVSQRTTAMGGAGSLTTPTAPQYGQASIASPVYSWPAASHTSRSYARSHVMWASPRSVPSVTVFQASSASWVSTSGPRAHATLARWPSHSLRGVPSSPA